MSRCVALTQFGDLVCLCGCGWFGEWQCAQHGFGLDLIYLFILKPI